MIRKIICTMLKVPGHDCSMHCSQWVHQDCTKRSTRKDRRVEQKVIQSPHPLSSSSLIWGLELEATGPASPT
jgi:hypothetical protein